MMNENTMKSVSIDYESFGKWENDWRTDIGGWFPGERVLLRGKNLLEDLGHMNWMGLLLFSITGRQFNEQQIKLFEGVWVISSSFPEPRLWNNRVAALAGTARSTSGLGVSAGMAVSEAIVYGHRPSVAAMNFLHRIKQRMDKGERLDDVLRQIIRTPSKGKPGFGKNRQVSKLPGFGRPIISSDERLQPLLQLAKELGFRQGPHVQLAEQIEKTLNGMGHAFTMNVAALVGALSADQGLTSQQFYHYAIMCFNAGIMSCAIDAGEKPEGAFFPLRCSRIKYTGKEQRTWI